MNDPNVKKNIKHFKDTFQKPSRIYRFLFEEWRLHPLFLNRTLSYVNKHRARRIKQSPTIADVLDKLRKKRSNSCKDDNKSCPKSTIESRCYVKCKAGGKVCCLYNWMCDDAAGTTQKTRSFNFSCPWCDVDYRHLDTLVMHLKCCHPRFNFNLVEEDGYSVIEMSKNTSYDGSYFGFKYPGHDQKRDFRFAHEIPQRRENLTQIIFFRSKRKRSSHFIARYSPTDHYHATVEDGNEVDVDVCSGRLYYHTSTCLPVKANEGDIDSEADMDPDWLKERTQLMIDEFTDVNEGEKEVLKLWNLHIMSRENRYKSDSMIPKECLEFIDKHGQTIIARNLTKNLVLHLANLYDYGLLGSGDVLECTRKLKKMKSPVALSSPTRAASKHIKQERNSNEHCQLSQPAKRERALLDSHCN